MEFLLLREAIVLLACAVSAYTDWKDGLILDKITYPLIGIGIALNLLENDLAVFILPVAVFVTGYAIYYAGKVGGGDVKLLAGIAMVLPSVRGEIFIFNAMLIASSSAIVFLSAYFVSKYARTGIDWKENSRGTMRALMFAAFIAAYFWFLLQWKIMPLSGIIVFAVPVAFALVFLALEHGIRKNFFLQEAKLPELEEDEIVAVEFLDSKVLEKLGLKFKGVLGEKEIGKLKEMGLKTVPVYRKLPAFAPFILLGAVVAIAWPGMVAGLFI